MFNILTTILLSSVLFIISILGPGLIAADYFNWDKIEKLVGVIGVSLVFNYLLSFGIYIIDLPQWAYFIQALINVVLFISHYKTLNSFLRDSLIIKIFYGYLAIACWMFLYNTLILNFSGGLWSTDWYEHYLRTIFFLERMATNTIFFGIYILPARPPLMNLLASYYLAIFGNDYYVFQHIFTLLNTLVFFPIYLFAKNQFGNNGKVVLLVVVLLIFNPLFVQNSTYTWTKLLTAFFILYSVYLYISSWESKDKLKLTMAGIMMAAGVMTHYSAVPYALFLTLHYLAYLFWHRQNKIKELLINAFISITILLSWFAWSLNTYGIKGTLFSNTAFTDTQSLTLYENISKILNNIYYSLVPHFMNSDENWDVPLFISGTENWVFKIQNTPDYPRDFMFLLYQTNLYFAFGSMGLMIIAYIAIFKFRNERYTREKFLFWVLFVTFNIILGIAVHGTLEPYGIIHICLQPIILLGIAYIAGNFYKLPELARLIVLAGLTLDFLLGIVLHLYVQNITPNDSATLWKGFSWTVHNNWNMKLLNEAKFIADYFVDYQPLLWSLLIVFTIAAIIQLSRTRNKSLE